MLGLEQFIPMATMFIAPARKAILETGVTSLLIEVIGKNLMVSTTTEDKKICVAIISSENDFIMPNDERFKRFMAECIKRDVFNLLEIQQPINALETIEENKEEETLFIDKNEYS